jgi:hypothetical protein
MVVSPRGSRVSPTHLEGKRQFFVIRYLILRQLPYSTTSGNSEIIDRPPHTSLSGASDMATADNDTDTKTVKFPRHSYLIWIPRLSLLAVVSSFGNLYLSSIDRDSTDDTAQVITAQEGGSAGTSEDTSGFQQIVGKPSNFKATAETFIADATTADSSGVKQVVDYSKDLTPSQTTTVETAAVETITGEPLVTETTAKTSLTPTDKAQSGAVEPEATAATGRVTQPMSGFERHNAPLPVPAFGTAAMRGTGQQPLAPQPIFRADVTPYRGIPTPRLPAFDQPQEAMAQYRARALITTPSKTQLSAARWA